MNADEYRQATVDDLIWASYVPGEDKGVLQLWADVLATRGWRCYRGPGPLIFNNDRTPTMLFWQEPDGYEFPIEFDGSIYAHPPFYPRDEKEGLWDLVKFLNDRGAIVYLVCTSNGNYKAVRVEQGLARAHGPDCLLDHPRYGDVFANTKAESLAEAMCTAFLETIKKTILVNRTLWLPGTYKKLRIEP